MDNGPIEGDELKIAFTRHQPYVIFPSDKSPSDKSSVPANLSGLHEHFLLWGTRTAA
jgi:hypothetical protein